MIFDKKTLKTQKSIEHGLKLPRVKVSDHLPTNIREIKSYFTEFHNKEEVDKI